MEGYNFLTIKSAEGASIKPRVSLAEYEASRERIIQTLREQMLGEALIARQKLRVLGLLDA